jgi:hypothetical protein
MRVTITNGEQETVDFNDAVIEVDSTFSAYDSKYNWRRFRGVIHMKLDFTDAEGYAIEHPTFTVVGVTEVEEITK